MLRIATWNVNSLRVRLETLAPWLTQDGPDVVCLQETKVTDDLFPIQALADLGYQVVFTGQKTYNGVALLSRLPIADVVLALPGAPLEDEKRFIAATIAGVRVINVYVPNGQAVGSPKFFYKLAWLQALQTFLATAYTSEDVVLVCGDFNVAPEDADVHDPMLWRGAIMCSEGERAAFHELCKLGLTDTLRLHHNEAGLFSWWDYRMLAFPKNRGLRIDVILASSALAKRCTAAGIDREMRKGKEPSDHAPVWAEFKL